MIPFYITSGSEFILVGNEILHKSNFLASKYLLIIPCNVCGLSAKNIFFTTYNDASGNEEVSEMRTLLMIVLSNVNSIKNFFFSLSFITINEDSPGTLGDLSDKKITLKFAHKLHAYSHLTVKDMVTVCIRARGANTVLEQALKSAIERCTSCQ